MSQQKHVQAYLHQQVMTSSPAKLVSMLYDRAILSLQEAVEAIKRGDIEARWRANRRAIDIIAHMWETLDAEKGGEIADNLGKLYRFVLGRLVFVDLHNDPAPAREAIELLTPLREAWRTLAHAAPAGTEPAAVAPADGPAARADLSA